MAAAFAACALIPTAGATVVFDFAKPGHGLKLNNDATDGRQTATGYAFRAPGDFPVLFSQPVELPPAPKGATIMTLLLETAETDFGSIFLYWSPQGHPGAYATERLISMRQVDATHFTADLPIACAPRGLTTFRFDTGKGLNGSGGELRRFSVDYLTPVWGGQGELKAPDRWADGEGETLVSGDCRLVHSRTSAGSFRFEASGKVRAEGGGDGPIVVVGSDGRPETVAFGGKPSFERTRDSLAVSSTGRDRAGRRWNVRRTFTAVKDGFAVETAVSCNRPADVLHLPYLTLSVDRASKGRKAQALLPGLEYLDDEPSSTTKGIRGPEANRLIPEASKLCFPLMALTDGHDDLALEWTPSEADGKPSFSPVFDTPDRLFGTGGHLFALWAPAVGVGRHESHPEVYGPMKGFTSGTAKARLTSARGATVADTLERVLPPEALPDLPRLDREQAVELLAHGWLDSGIRKGNEFKHALMSRSAYRRVVDAPTLMRYLAVTMKDRELADRLEKTAAKIRAGFPKDSKEAKGVGGKVSHIGQPVAPLDSGDPFAYAASQAGNLKGGVAELGSGTRRRRKDPKRAEDLAATLGADHCNGFAALRAAPMMRAATWSSDEKAIAEACAAVDKMLALYRGTVPRGAQPWEVPLYCPDIVASAHLVSSCVSAWLLTGDERYIAEARTWARTGFSMVYLADPPASRGGFCGRYATTAVMGATGWCAPNWMGRPVQWCGLFYGIELFGLAAIETDATLAAYWRKVASGIAISGVNQSHPEEDGENWGLMPDSTEMSAQRRLFVPINPGTLEENLAWLVGKPYYRCVRARSGRGASPLVHVAGDARALPAEEGELVRFSVDAWPVPKSKVFITRIARPLKVLVDDVETPFEWRDSQLAFEVPPRPAKVRVLKDEETMLKP